jgi:hypothetical protein
MQPGRFMGRRGAADSRRKKVFFFEKKKQKTFVFLLTPVAPYVSSKLQQTKVFWFFFSKKEHLALLFDRLRGRRSLTSAAVDNGTTFWKSPCYSRWRAKRAV